MGVNGIETNGQFVNTPDVYGQANFGANVGNSAPFKNLVLVGEFPYLKPKTPFRFTSQAALEAVFPGDLELLRKSSIIYRPSADERVPGGPADVWLCNVRPTTQATLDLFDAGIVPSIKLAAKVYGPKGNQTFVTVQNNSGVFTVSLSRDGISEAFSGISGTNLFTLEHTSNLFDTVVADYQPGADFVISGTKAGLPVGTSNFSLHPVSGFITVTPSVAPGVGESCTATITIIDENGAQQTLPALSWSEGDSAAKTTNVRATALSNIVFAKTGAFVPTFTVACHLLEASEADFPTVASLTSHLSGSDFSAVFTVSGVTPLAGQTWLTSIDPVVAASLKAGGKTFTNVKSAFVAALAPSQLVTATAYPAGGAPSAVGPVRLIGGTAPPTQSTDWDEALVACRLIPGRIYWPDSDSASIHAKIRAHTAYMAGPGAYDCNAWVGGAANETKSQIFARAQALNSRSVSLVAQEIQRVGPLGNLEWLPPKYLALLLAAMQAGTRESVTGKIPDIVAYRQNAQWSPERDRTEFHDNRVTLVGAQIAGGSPQPRVLRALTTYFGSSDPCRTDVRPVESISELLIFARSIFKPTIGGNTTAPVKVIENVWKATLQRAKELGIIGDFAEKSAKAVTLGNVTTLRALVVPVFSRDFVDIQVGVVASLTGAGFQLQITV